jgi:hypothetical protein
MTDTSGKAKLLHVEKHVIAWLDDHVGVAPRYVISIEAEGERDWPKLSRLIETAIRDLERPEPEKPPKPPRGAYRQSKPLEALVHTQVPRNAPRSE